MKTIGVLTSGGDAPGMNAAVRAVARTAIKKGIKVLGIRRGYNGLINGDLWEMNERSVSDIIQRGGTVLYTARCPEFRYEEGLQKAKQTCLSIGLEGIVVIGDQTVVVTVGVEAIYNSTQILGVPVSAINLAGGLQVKLSPQTVDVYISGPMNLLESIGTASVHVTLDLTGLTEGTYQLAPKVELDRPELRLDSTLPGLIEVVITK